MQPASLDLRLGAVAYRIRCSFLPGRQTVGPQVKDYDHRRARPPQGRRRPRDQAAVPHPARRSGCRLPDRSAGKANPKSSTGRIDVFTRVITDESYRFDEIADGYDGPLYLEVVPLSFPVRGRARTSRSTSCGCRSGARELTDDELREVHRDQPVAVPWRAARADRASWPCPTACSSASTCGATSEVRWATGRGSTRRCSTCRQSVRTGSTTTGSRCRARTATASCSTPSASTC